MRAAQQKMAAAVSSKAAEPEKQVLLDLKNGRAPTPAEVNAYNQALKSAKTVEISVDGKTREMSAQNALAFYDDSSYSRIAGNYTDTVNSIQVTVIE